MKLSKGECAKASKSYLATHRECWRPVKVNGLWRFCRNRVVLGAHHIARLRGTLIGESVANRFPLCDFPVGRCHQDYGHRARTDESEGRVTLRLFAVKMMFGEATRSEIEALMRGRNWWTVEMGKAWALQDELSMLAGEMGDLLETELPRRAAIIKREEAKCQK